jgi:Uma2 family endonuclease
LTLVDSEPEPDVSVVSGPEERYLRAHPVTAELAVEVAVSSVEIDRVKAGIYAEAGVSEYWIVCVDRREVEVYRRPQPAGYAERFVVSAPGVLECPGLAGVRVDLSALFA